MTDLADNFASLSRKDVAGNRFALLNKIQEQVYSAISALRSGKDLLSIKKNVEYILEKVNKNLDLIKASCKEEGTNRHLAGNGFYTLSAGWIMPGGGGGGVLLRILGQDVPPGSPNPDPISGKKMPLFTLLFRPGR